MAPTGERNAHATEARTAWAIRMLCRRLEDDEVVWLPLVCELPVLLGEELKPPALEEPPLNWGEAMTCEKRKSTKDKDRTGDILDGYWRQS